MTHPVYIKFFNSGGLNVCSIVTISITLHCVRRYTVDIQNNCNCPVQAMTDMGGMEY